MLTLVRSLLDRIRRKAAGRSLFGAATIIAAPLLLNVISLPVTALIIAKLGPLGYGSWSVALTLTTAGTMLTNVGLRNLLVRTVARSPETAAHAFAEHLGLRLVLVAAAGLVVLIICRLFGYPSLVLQCAAILALGMFFTAVGNVVSDVLQAFERLPLLATINMIAGLLLTVASLVAVWLGVGPVGLAVAYLAGPVFAAGASLTLVHRQLFPVGVTLAPARLGALLKESRHLGVPQVFTLLSYEADSILVPKLVGLADFGYFAAGILLPRRLMTVPDGLATAYFPVLSRKFHAGDHDTLASVRQFAGVMLLACVPAAVLLTALAGPISNLLFDEGRELCRLVLQYTVWAVPLIGFESGMGYLLVAAGRERDDARLSVIKSAIGLVMSVTLIWSFGLLGAAIALPAKGIVGIAIRLPYVLNILRAARASALEPQVPALT